MRLRPILIVLLVCLVIGATVSITCAQPDDDRITITGRLVAGTEGGIPLPEALEITLYITDTEGETVILKTDATADHTFRFDNVPRASANRYTVAAMHDMVMQFHVFESDDDQPTTEFVLYSRTSEPSEVTVIWLEMALDFAATAPSSIGVTVRLEVINNGDAIITLDEPTAPDDALFLPRQGVIIDLPPGAFDVTALDPDQATFYDFDAEQGRLIHTLPLNPARPRSLAFSYRLPYTTGAVLDHGIGYTVMDAWVLMPNDTVTFSSAQFDAEGWWCCRQTDFPPRIIELDQDNVPDPATDFTLIRAHSLLAPVATNERLVFELTGAPTTTLNPVAGSVADQAAYYYEQGAALVQARQYDAALEAFGQAVVFYAQTNDQQGHANALIAYGRTQRSLWDLAGAVDSISAALSIYETLGDFDGQYDALSFLAAAYRDQRQLDPAIEYFTQALVIARLIGDRLHEGHALNNLGEVQRMNGDYEPALANCQHAVDIARTVGDRPLEAHALENIGEAHWLLKNYDEALTYYFAALDTIRELKHFEQETYLLYYIGEVYIEQKEYAKALEYLPDAVDNLRILRDRWTTGVVPNLIGMAHLELGDLEQAEVAFSEALEIAIELGDVPMGGAALDGLNVIAVQQE